MERNIDRLRKLEKEHQKLLDEYEKLLVERAVLMNECRALTDKAKRHQDEAAALHEAVKANDRGLIQTHRLLDAILGAVATLRGSPVRDTWTLRLTRESVTWALNSLDVHTEAVEGDYVVTAKLIGGAS